MHAEIARELRAGGDPFALTLNGVPYLDKPPLLYVLLAGAFAVGGERETVARSIPAAAALAAVAATAWLGARLLGLGGGVLAGSALLTSVGFYAFGRYVRPETLLLAALAGGFALVLTGLRDGRRPLVVAGWALFGLAGLAKDPLAALAAPVTVGVALALAGTARPLSRWMPWSGVTLWAVLAFGWWALAEARTPGFTWYTVVDNHLLNVVRARYFPDEDVPLAAGQFLAVAALAAAPWVISAAVAIAGLVRRRAWREPHELAWVALALWGVGVFALTTLSPFRLPHYGLPAYPAVALLAARGWREHGGRRLVVAHAIVLGAFAVALAFVWTSPGGVQALLDATDVATRKAEAAGRASSAPWLELQRLAGGSAIAVGVGAGALTALALRRQVSGPIGAAVVLAAMLGVLPAVAAALEHMSAQRASRGIALEITRHAGAGDLVLHEGPIENSGALEWYGGRRPLLVDGRRSVLGFGATVNGAAGGFWDAERLRAAWGEQRVWLVTTRPPGHTLAATLPAARLVAADGGRWLYVNR